MVSSLCDSCCAKPAKIKNGGSITSRNSMYMGSHRDFDGQDNAKSVLGNAERMNQSAILNDKYKSPVHCRSAERRQEGGKDQQSVAAFSEANFLTLNSD